MNKRIVLYDATLRDGAQAEQVSFSLDDKLRITEALDDFGVSYIEGGYPGSNPRDKAFFIEVKKLRLKNATVTAFGSTHHPKKKPEDDPNLATLLSADTSSVTIVGKSWDQQAQKILGISPKRNLSIIHNTIKFLKQHADEVMFDAEHFFDGYKNNPQYALEALESARDAGADWLVLCDTNGGCLPLEVGDITADVVAKFPKNAIAIHCHNDSDTGVANTLAAVSAGAKQVQGTINGIGERCGNADLLSITANLQMKMGYKCITASNLKKLKEVSSLVYELANMPQRPYQPYVGKSAFAHKGGLHVAAVRKEPWTYEHVEPESVGGTRRVLVSDLSGKSNVLHKAEQFGIDLTGKGHVAKEILDRLKKLESEGFLFEGAEASFELLIRKATGQWKKKFDVVRARVVSSFSNEAGDNWAEAVIKLRLPDGSTTHAVAEGNGPVNALDQAVRRALVGNYPQLADVTLHDFKVRLLDDMKTASLTRVLIESGDSERRWSTVGVSANVIEASWQALLDSLEYKLHHSSSRKKTAKKKK